MVTSMVRRKPSMSASIKQLAIAVGGVAHGDIEPAEGRHGLGHQPFDLFLVGDVPLDRSTARPPADLILSTAAVASPGWSR